MSKYSKRNNMHWFVLAYFALTGIIKKFYLNFYHFLFILFNIKIKIKINKIYFRYVLNIKI